MEILEQYQPKYYQKNVYENATKTHYGQPQTYIFYNGKKEKYLDFHENNPNISLAKISNESFNYNETLNILNLSLWNNYDNLEKAFLFLLNWQINESSSSSTTPLCPFEINLIQNDFKLEHFCELNSFNPFWRSYIKYDFKGNIIKKIYTGFGFAKHYFYFKVDNNSPHYEINNDLELFEDAINEKFESIESKIIKQLK